MRVRIPRRLRPLAASMAAGVLLVPATGAAAAPTQGMYHTGDRTARHDVTFIAMLVPHHQTAVQMASIARDKATNPQVRRLAAHIVDEQSRQISQMRAWLRQHNAKPMPPPAPIQEMERQDIHMLRAAQADQVDQLFLMMMRPHHAQAVSEAEDELQHGRNDFAVSVARTIKTDQSQELAKMNDLLAALT